MNDITKKILTRENVSPWCTKLPNDLLAPALKYNVKYFFMRHGTLRAFVAYESIFLHSTDSWYTIVDVAGAGKEIIETSKIRYWESVDDYRDKKAPDTAFPEGDFIRRDLVTRIDNLPILDAGRYYIMTDRGYIYWKCYRYDRDFNSVLPGKAQFALTHGESGIRIEFRGAVDVMNGSGKSEEVPVFKTEFEAELWAKTEKNDVEVVDFENPGNDGNDESELRLIVDVYRNGHFYKTVRGNYKGSETFMAGVKEIVEELQ